jgi:hypothetical protein
MRQEAAMPIGAIGDTVSIRPGSPRRRASERPIEADYTVVETRAVAAVEPVTRSDSLPDTRGRPLATFVDQLIAPEMDLPQTRARRRAEVEVVEAAYAAVAADAPRSRILAVL